MPRFILNQNQQANGDQEIHNKTTGCFRMPAPSNQIDLGEYLSCHGAVLEAKLRYPSAKIDGCAHCCPSCHTS